MKALGKILWAGISIYTLACLALYGLLVLAGVRD
jgi:hypothetical protein